MNKKNKIALLFLLFMTGIMVTGYAQEQEAPFKLRKYAPDMGNFEKHVKEAYGEKANELVFEEPSRLKTIKNIYQNSIVVVESAYKFKKNVSELSTVPLLKRYNSSVSRTSFFPETFNPLKFRFDFYSNEKQFFHVDGTNYYIIIKPFEIRRD